MTLEKRVGIYQADSEIFKITSLHNLSDIDISNLLADPKSSQVIRDQLFTLLETIYSQNFSQSVLDSQRIKNTANNRHQLVVYFDHNYFAGKSLAAVGLVTYSLGKNQTKFIFPLLPNIPAILKPTAYKVYIDEKGREVTDGIAYAKGFKNFLKVLLDW